MKYTTLSVAVVVTPHFCATHSEALSVIAAERAPSSSLAMSSGFITPVAANVLTRGMALAMAMLAPTSHLSTPGTSILQLRNAAVVSRVSDEAVNGNFRCKIFLTKFCVFVKFSLLRFFVFLYFFPVFFFFPYFLLFFYW